MSMGGMSGFSLLEVLLALFILSFCILGMVGLQTSAMRHTQDAYFRSVATVQIANLAERSLIGDLIPANEITDWKQAAAALLPNGAGSYNDGLKTSKEIALSWTSHFAKEDSLTLSLKMY